MLQSITRGAVRAFLGTARLPVCTAERLVRPADTETWPPNLAFSSFEALTHQLAGSVLRDAELARRGRLEQARVAELRDAVRLETMAEQAVGEAEESFQSRRETAQKRREEAGARAEKRKQQVEEAAREDEARARREAQDKRKQARRAEEVVEEAIDDQAEQGRRRTVQEEREAVSAAKDATAARALAVDKDEELQRSRAERRNGG